jgi:predicted alpha-1,2-mannosidase
MKLWTWLLVCVALNATANTASSASERGGKSDLVRWVDPFIGTGGHGHTYPGPTLPFGMIQPGPDTRLTGWDGCSGYHYSDSTVYGFSHTHLSGTGIPDYCDVLFLPATGAVKLRNNYENPAHDGYGSRFRKATERATPGYYAVTLDDYGVDVELTATLRTGWHRYTFHRTDNAHVLIDLTHRDEVIDSYIRVLDSRRIEGLRRSKSWAKDQIVYFAAEFDHDFDATLFVDDSQASEARGKNVKAVLRFNLKKGARVHAKVALSSVDEAGAWANLKAEAPSWDFDATRKSARRTWNDQLHKIEVEGGTDEQRTIFYTALYHTMLQPNTFEDVDGRFRGMDGQVHDSPGYTRYSVFSLWDTFRAAHPLYTIIERARTLDFIQTFLAMYQESGRLPVWELWGNETDCMIGYHAVSVITDAYVKGIRGFDENLALEAMIAAADADRFGLDAYKKYGYIPADMESESVSKTLEYAYDDWCISSLARVMGHSDDWRRLKGRAQAWVHLFDANGFLRPRANGRWVDPFDPTEVTFHYTEANAWQYRFAVSHDLYNFMRFLEKSDPRSRNFRDALEYALDQMFEGESRTTGREQADITGLIGQYAHGNEPSHHIAYLYLATNHPAKAQTYIRRIMNEMYTATPDGLVGNEDCGQLSAWFVFGAMGFYPVIPGSDTYWLASPLFEAITINLENQERFRVVGLGAGWGYPYVRSAMREGDWAVEDAFSHSWIESGKTVELRVDDWNTPHRDDVELPRVEISIVPAPIVDAPVTFTDETFARLVAASPDDQIFYTLDGRDPYDQSARYDRPVAIRENTLLRFRSIASNGLWSPIVDATFRKIDANVKLTMRNPVHRQYQAGGELALIDGIRGGDDFRLGTWQGYYGVDLDADVDLGKPREIHRVATGFLADQNSWIFFPLEVVYSVSENGKTWKEIGRATTETDPHHDGVVVEDFAVELSKPVRVRYVRILARAPIMCPDWHKGAGNRAFIFADEIVVE